MRIRNLSPADVYQAIQAQNVEVSAGNVGQPIGNDNRNAYQYSLTVKGRLTSPEEFGNIILRTESDGKILRLRDVAHIDLGSASYSVVSQLDGKPTAAIAIYNREAIHWTYQKGSKQRCKSYRRISRQAYSIM